LSRNGRENFAGQVAGVQRQLRREEHSKASSVDYETGLARPGTESMTERQLPLTHEELTHVIAGIDTAAKFLQTTGQI
jgi:hypothetical protein